MYHYPAKNVYNKMLRKLKCKSVDQFCFIRAEILSSPQQIINIHLLVLTPPMCVDTDTQSKIFS